MSHAEELLLEALRQLGPKPEQGAKQREKKRYSERLSAGVALALAEELRLRGLPAYPAPPGELGTSGAERRIAGGISAKKVDVSCATPESGLILAISVKSINFADETSKNFQKNLTNRRGDMLFEAVTLHRRFPYAVLAGVFFFEEAAEQDGTSKRSSTFLNAHQAFRLFTGRSDPAGRDEQFERLYIVLHGSGPDGPTARFYEAGDPNQSVALDTIFEKLIDLVGERNADLYEAADGSIRSRWSSRRRRATGG